MYYENQTEFAEFVKENQRLLFSQKNKSVLVQVFCGRNEITYIKQLVAEISAELPLAHIVGVTTSGEIIDGEVCGRKTVLAISIFEKTDVRVRSFCKEDQDDFVLGKQIATALGSDVAKILILFGAGNQVTAEEVLKGIEVENPELLVAGGSAGQSARENPAMVFDGQDIIENGFIGIVLEGTELDARLYSHLGWHAIGKAMTITKAEGNRVYTINSIPAYQVYRRYLGIDKYDDFLNAVEFPLIIKRNEVLMARTPMIYYDDDSIGFAGEVLQGDIVRLSFGDAGLISEMVEKLCQEIQRKAVESIFVYSCESRRGFLQDLSSCETRPLQKIAPTVGFFTVGEYYHIEGKNYFLNATMTVLTLSEEGEGESIQKEALFCAIPERSIYPDSVADRSKGVLKALAHLVTTVTTELEAANQNLHYIGLHDSLTGVYNRTFFDQEIKRLKKNDDAVGIIICDMDCLKILNDTLGHEFGDKTIKVVANILRQACRKDDVLARIGGDEFAILVERASKEELEAVCLRIEASAQKVRELDPTSFSYLSIGFAQREQGSEDSLSKIFTIADRAMYQYKLKRKEKVRKSIIRDLKKMNCKIVDTRS